MPLPERIQIKEVGPRDGLQNETEILSTEAKIEWINALSQTGLSYIEITSFVHPKWIPQLADALEVASAIRRKEGVTYAALVPNLKGLQRALQADVDEVAVFMSASEAHNKKNINKSIGDTYRVLNEVIEEAKEEQKSVRGYISTVFGCPYEGKVSVDDVLRICDRLFEMGIDECSLGDTIGVANPKQVQDVLTKLERYFPKHSLALHFHNTRGTALANVWAAMELGYERFDSALGGLGGCPYAKGASGNLATDDLLYMVQEMGYNTGIDELKLREAASLIQGHLNKELPSHQMSIVNRGGIQV
ncbi:hydroxymethylglutaryl-CoA lyase [Pontibacillus halophilus JSM 076056 = DSM 19796]|uniref:Hydroxymethylglutaryl-CoA lyase n=1 Tax=Pontibacillus halophilus JSM 076056 = DSM 19796 TaxID=1385510 RepID=A0A0A5GFN2_9BACI|nr:hydroxymethylglutaryl-CoA lyase [Pontibacillus halophilus]KGX92026.1 hydroxymethylglutaryl-CoA lyase [Pontibacillus halophilus JSM 076056 = DSM 19796]